MKPEDVPADLVEKVKPALRDLLATEGVFPPLDHPRFDFVARRILAAVLPAHKQQVTAKYRRFVKAVREITKSGEAYQTPKSQGGGGDECTISPPELRQALTDLRHGRS